MHGHGRSEGAEEVENWITGLLLDHAQNVPKGRTLDPGLSLRQDLQIESLSLVSVALRIGEDMNVDLVELGIDLGHLETVGDLMALGRELIRIRRGAAQAAPLASP